VVECRLRVAVNEVKKSFSHISSSTFHSMVLAELGQKIAGALRSLATKTVIDQGEHPTF
jgi:hypothetical protein